MGDHLGIIIFSSILLILLNSLISLSELHKTPNIQISEQKYAKKQQKSVADPGFPVGGGVDLVGGAVDPRGGYVSKILHVKTKESGPVGGGGARRARPLDPPMEMVEGLNSYESF